MKPRPGLQWRETPVVVPAGQSSTQICKYNQLRTYMAIAAVTSPSTFGVSSNPNATYAQCRGLGSGAASLPIWDVWYPLHSIAVQQAWYGVLQSPAFSDQLICVCYEIIDYGPTGSDDGGTFAVDASGGVAITAAPDPAATMGSGPSGLAVGPGQDHNLDTPDMLHQWIQSLRQLGNKLRRK